MKCQILFSRKNKKNILNFLSVESAHRVVSVKGSIFLKHRHFLYPERFNKLIYGINTIIKCCT